MSIQQNMASDIYRMADSVHRSRDIAAFQQSLAQSIKSGAVESYVGIPVLQSLTQKLKLAQQKEAMAMAAPQGQQQQGVPIAAQVMQDAGQTDEDEQRYAGIDELRTNLPTEDDDDNEYANGGIIAFSGKNNDQVVDSNSDPLVERLREDDPKSYERFMSGNTISPEFGGFDANPKTVFERNSPEYDPVPTTPAGRFIANQATDIKSGIANYDLRQRLYEQYSKSADPFSSVSNPEREAGRDMLSRIKDMSPAELRALDRQGNVSASAAVSTVPSAPPPQELSTFNPPNDAGVGVAGLPAAQNVQIAPAKQGAGTAAPAGGERLTPRVGLENAPPTLAQAEAVAGKSPAAAKAISAADEYIAMLKKSGESVGREKKEAFYMALISGGLAAAGGTSPNALANIAAGMVPATQQYQKVIAGIRKDDRERLEKLMSAGLKKDEFALKAEEIGINRQKAKDWFEVMTERNNVMRSRGGDSDLKLQAEVRKTEQMYGGLIGKEQTGFDNYLKANQIYDRIDPTNVPPSLKKGYDNYARKVEGYQNRIDNLHQQKNKRIERVTGETYSEEPSSSGKVPTIANQTEYDKLPKGTQYKDPNGVLRTKG